MEQEKVFGKVWRRPVLVLIGKKGTAIAVFPQFALMEFQSTLLDAPDPENFNFSYAMTKREFIEDMLLVLCSAERMPGIMEALPRHFPEC